MDPMLLVLFALSGPGASFEGGAWTPLQSLELRGPAERDFALDLAVARDRGTVVDETSGRARLGLDGTPLRISYGDIAFTAVGLGLRVEHGLLDLSEALGQLARCPELADVLTEECEGPMCAEIETGIGKLCRDAVEGAASAAAKSLLGLAGAR